MGTWNSRGLRGSTLEDMINYTNTRYEEMGLALIQKVPTPITPVRIDKERRHITLAYFDKVSTVDYIGAVQGIPICFDAKECAADTFPLQNVHEHQVSFMEKYEKQQGISFLIIYYSQKETLYYMRFEELLKFWKRARKDADKLAWIIPFSGQVITHFETRNQRLILSGFFADRIGVNHWFLLSGVLIIGIVHIDT